MNEKIMNLLLTQILLKLQKVNPIKNYTETETDSETEYETESDKDTCSFDYETENTITNTCTKINSDDNINFIKLNNLNTDIKTHSINNNVYLKLNNQEYKNIGLQIDSISNESKTKSNVSNSNTNTSNSSNSNDNIINSIKWNLSTTRNSCSDDNKSDSYIDIIDSNKLWDMIEKNNKTQYLSDTFNYDNLSLESESLNSILKNKNNDNDNKSVFINNLENNKSYDNLTHSEMMNNIMNSNSANDDLLDSYNFSCYNKDIYDKNNSNSSSNSTSNNNSDSDNDSIDLVDTYNTYNNENRKQSKSSDSNSLSDNMSILDTYCMSAYKKNESNDSSINEKTTTTLEECKNYRTFNEILSEDNNQNNIFNMYVNNYNKNNSQINDNPNENTKNHNEKKENVNLEEEEVLVEQPNEDRFTGKHFIYSSKALLFRR